MRTRGTSGGPTSPSEPGARSARTTAATATLGVSSRTITLDPCVSLERGRDGRRLRTSATSCAWHSRCGTGRSDPQGADVRPDRAEGNHGEDAKEYWWYLDGLPIHAWLRWRYHYPQRDFPTPTSSPRTRGAAATAEYELHRHRHLRRRTVLDRVTVDYAKASPTDILVQVDVENRGPEEATLHVLPTLWFRNTWRWNRPPTPRRSRLDGDAGASTIRSRGYRLEAAPGPDGAPEALFCDNETNAARLYGSPSVTPFPKDGINDHVDRRRPDREPGRDRDEGRLVVPRHRAWRRTSGDPAPPPPPEPAVVRPAGSPAGRAVFAETVAGRQRGGRRVLRRPGGR